MTSLTTKLFASWSSTRNKDSDFAKWDHKARIFTRASFGHEMLDAMSGVRKQSKPIAKDVVEDTFIAYTNVRGADAQEIDRTPDI